MTTEQSNRPDNQLLGQVDANLREALAQAWNLPDADAVANAVGEKLTEAVRVLGQNAALAADDIGRYALVQQTMSHLQDAIGHLHALSEPSAAATAVTKTVAHALSVLYPVSKASRTPEGVPPTPRPTRPNTRRSAPRFGIEVDIGFHTETNFFTGFTEDISEGGVFLATYDLLPLGTQISLAFRLPGGYAMACTGEVRWTREASELSDGFPGMGVKFIDLADKDRRLIEKFIARRPALFFDED